MRLRILLLVNLISILSVGIAYSNILTVCDSGCDYTNGNTALAAGGGAGTTIQFGPGNLTAQTTATTILSNNASVFQWAAASTIVNNGNVGIFIFTNGCTSAVTFLNPNWKNTGTALDVSFSTLGAGFSSAWIGTNNNQIISHVGTNHVFQLQTGFLLSTTNQLYFKNLKIDCRTSNMGSNRIFDMGVGNTILVDNVCWISNCLLIGDKAANSAGRIIQYIPTVPSTATWLRFFNNTVYNSALFCATSAPVNGINDVIVDCTAYITMTINAANSNFVTCGFTTNITSPGSGTVTLTTGKVFVNPVPPTGSQALNVYDYRLSPQSIKTNYSGAVITGSTNLLDLVGNSYSSSAPSMGCFQYYCPIGMGYGCSLWDILMDRLRLLV